MFESARLFGYFASKFARPQNVVYPGLLAGTYAFMGSNNLWSSMYCYLAIFSLYALAVGYNNVTDIETDRINRRFDNPLINNQLKKSTLVTYFAVNILLLILVQIVAKQPGSALVCLVYIALSIAYSNPRLNIKSRGFYSTITLCICYGCLPILFGVVQNNLYLGNLVFICVFQLFLLFPIVLAKDYKDLEGDKQTGKRTPLVKYGAKVVAVISVGIASVVSIVFLFQVGLEPKNLPLLIAGTYLSLVALLHRHRGTINRYLKLALILSTLSVSILLSL